MQVLLLVTFYSIQLLPNAIIFLYTPNSFYFQDDTTFEKQSALFALAISDVVLINM